MAIIRGERHGECTGMNADRSDLTAAAAAAAADDEDDEDDEDEEERDTEEMEEGTPSGLTRLGFRASNGSPRASNELSSGGLDKLYTTASSSTAERTREMGELPGSSSRGDGAAGGTAEPRKLATRSSGSMRRRVERWFFRLKNGVKDFEEKNNQASSPMSKSACVLILRRLVACFKLLQAVPSSGNIISHSPPTSTPTAMPLSWWPMTWQCAKVFPTHSPVLNLTTTSPGLGTEMESLHSPTS